MFEYWRSALSLRKELKKIIVYGDFELLDKDNDDIFAYARSNGGQKVVVVCNFKERKVPWPAFTSAGLKLGKVLLSNYPEVDLEQETLVLRPFEAFVYHLS